MGNRISPPRENCFWLKEKLSFFVFVSSLFLDSFIPRRSSFMMDWTSNGNIRRMQIARHLCTCMCLQTEQSRVNVVSLCLPLPFLTISYILFLSAELSSLQLKYHIEKVSFTSAKVALKFLLSCFSLEKRYNLRTARRSRSRIFGKR